MRSFATVLLALICAPALWAMLATHSVLSYTGDPEAVTASARASDLHGFAVRAGEMTVVEEMRQSAVDNPELEALVRAETRAVVRRTLDPEWLYSSFAALYGDALAVVLDRQSGDPGGRSIDFRDRKKKLADGLIAIGDTIERECERIFGDRACRDPDARRTAGRAHRAAVSRAIATLPDRFSLGDLLARTGKDWRDPDSRTRRDIRRAVGAMNMIRVAAAAVLALGLLLIAVINLASLSRLFVALGVVLALSGAVYLAAAHGADAAVEKLIIESRLEEQAAVTPRDDPVGELARQAGATVTVTIARDALHHADGIAMAIAALGGCLLLGGFAIRRRGEKTSGHVG